MPALSQKRLFQLSSLVALGGWSILLVLPGWAMGPKVVLGVAVVLLCVLYGAGLVQALTSRGDRSMGKPGFFSLRGVLALFSNPKAVLAAWIHILAFDLLAGRAAGHQPPVDGAVLPADADVRPTGSAAVSAGQPAARRRLSHFGRSHLARFAMVLRECWIFP